MDDDWVEVEDDYVSAAPSPTYTPTCRRPITTMKTVSSCTGEEKPYVEHVVITTEYRYNPNYGDDRVCVCGHPYYRHFDTYEEMDACGCKYCQCHEFVESAGECTACCGQGWIEKWADVHGHYNGGEYVRYECIACNGTGQENKRQRS